MRKLVIFIFCIFISTLIMGSTVVVGDGGYTMKNGENSIRANNQCNIQEMNTWKLCLVNPWKSIKANDDIELAQLTNGELVDERILPDLEDMLKDARMAGLSVIVCSGYRTMEEQTTLFNNKVQELIGEGCSEEEARNEGKKWVAEPGTSEHQIGLAIDIVGMDNQILNEDQEKTKTQKWLMANCYDYGFILRYPKGKMHITGIGYEPWHYRYVGKEVAKEIQSKGVTLEEYLSK